MSLNNLSKRILLLLLIILGFYSCQVLAGDSVTKCDWLHADIGDIAACVTGSFGGIGQLMVATSYLAGIGFSIGSIFKFKQHRDNPTQVPIGTPLSLLTIGMVLVFMPGIVQPVGMTIFGFNSREQAPAGGFNGSGTGWLPGGAPSVPSNPKF